MIPGFGPEMEDFDGRPLKVTALYHKEHADPKLTPQPPEEPFYWNFLEMEFDTAKAEPTIALRIRNMIDPPSEPPRGGGSLSEKASESGRPVACLLPEIKTLANADVRFVQQDGLTFRGVRSLNDGSVSIKGLTDVDPGTKIIVTAFNGETSQSQTIRVL